MSNVSATPSRSPFLSVWLAPRATIDEVLRTGPRRHVLLLAGLAAVSEIIAALVQAYGFWPGLLGWRIVAAVIFGGAVLGIVSLYLWAWLLKWLGRSFGGKAATESIRAALAWGGVPQAIGIPICLVGCIALVSFGLASSHALAVAFRIIAVALGLWAWIWIVLTYKHVEHFGAWRAIAGLALSALIAFAIPTAFRAFFFQPFNTPSTSMMPTLITGDYFFGAKYPYGYTRFSLPLSAPLFSGRLLAAEPRRGDVVIFRLPKDVSIDYIKRVVGLPGDKIQMIDGVLNINGEPVKRERIEDFITNEDGAVRRVRQYRETMPNGVSYNTLELGGNRFYANTPVYTVPAGHYFMIGDNRDNSTDSRNLSQVGYVPFENLIGRAEIIYYSTTEGAEPRIRSERIGMGIH